MPDAAPAGRGSIVAPTCALLVSVFAVCCGPVHAESQSDLVNRDLQSCVALGWRSFSEKNPATQAAARAYVAHAATWNHVAKLRSGRSRHADVCLTASEQRRVALQVLGVRLSGVTDLYWTWNSSTTMPHHNRMGLSRLRAASRTLGRSRWTFRITESQIADTESTRVIGRGAATVIIFPTYVRVLEIRARYARSRSSADMHFPHRGVALCRSVRR
jgi:hypothetical protein